MSRKAFESWFDAIAASDSHRQTAWAAWQAAAIHLAKPQAEPVGSVYEIHMQTPAGLVVSQHALLYDKRPAVKHNDLLYAAPVRQAVQEPQAPPPEWIQQQAAQRGAEIVQPAVPVPLTDEVGLPPKYMLAKLQLVMPLLQEARDALTAITELQRLQHGISSTLADRMDAAGTFSLDDWRASEQVHDIGGAKP